MTRKNLYQATNIPLGVWAVFLLFSLLPQQPKAQLNDLTQTSINEIAEIEQKAAMNQSLRSSKNSMLSQASSNFDIHHIVCNWNIDPAIRYIQGNVKFGFTITEKTNSITFDLANELIVDSIRYKNRKITFLRPSNNSVVINLGVILEKNIKDEITIFYKGVPPVANSPFSTFTNSTHAGVPVMWTLSEPYGGKDWWPCKNGLNDKADSIDISITTPDKYTSSSNGLLTKELLAGGKRTTYWKHRYPIATYLIAIAATNYTIIKDSIQLGNKWVPLMEHAYPERINEFKNAASITKRTMQLLHNTFTPYPFINERYGHTQFGFSGGMEHQTNSFMVNMNETLVVHELAHQWFGNKITCGSWKDIWLNEGFAIFCTNYNIEKFYSETALINLYRSQINFITSNKKGTVYVYDTTSVSRIFDSRLTYTKGGWVLQMLRWKLGDEYFFKGVKSYLEDPALAYKYAVTQDLQKHFEIASGKNLDEFFKDWVYGSGYPSYQLKWNTLGKSWVNLTLSQTSSDSTTDFFEMPVPIRFKNALRDTTIIIEHQKNGQTGIVNIGFIADSAFIDPKLKIISANNTIIKTEAVANDDDIIIFPNPVKSSVNVLISNLQKGSLQLSLYNSVGQVVWQKRNENFRGSELYTIPTDQLLSGIYWLSIKKDKEKAIVRRILK
jgi:aminopeptidase N